MELQTNGVGVKKTIRNGFIKICIQYALVLENTLYRLQHKMKPKMKNRKQESVTLNHQTNEKYFASRGSMQLILGGKFFRGNGRNNISDVFHTLDFP